MDGSLIFAAVIFLSISVWLFRWGQKDAVENFKKEPKLHANPNTMGTFVYRIVLSAVVGLIGTALVLTVLGGLGNAGGGGGDLTDIYENARRP